ncbi:nucleotidyltransferase domain-containing protein [Micromonospora sp. URMC 103]|uniref:nucleotidyltransferase domain-containing protein n=1 Tax=Micromonospora sp. URMC 103 TaxID=3423406 RepID=UPI003F1D2CF7
MRYDPQRHIWSALSVGEVRSLFPGCPARWWLSGGWAIDHWLETTSRHHGDIDVSTLRPALPALLDSMSARLRPFAAMNGHLLSLAEHLDDPALHNIWLRDEKRDRWVLQINLEDGDEAVWRYRRDPRITLPWSRAVAPVRGVPTGTPATQLLWKSRDPRTRDEHDLRISQGILDAEERRWLREAIRTAHPQSPWVRDVV